MRARDKLHSLRTKFLFDITRFFRGFFENIWALKKGKYFVAEFFHCNRSEV